MTEPVPKSAEREGTARDAADGRWPSETGIRAAPGPLASMFLTQLALYTDGIGWVQVLECWRRHGLLTRLARAGSGGLTLGELAEASGANPGYLAVVCRVLDAQGWLQRDLEHATLRTRVAPTPAGATLFSLIEFGPQATEVSAFSPIARNMAAYLDERYEPPPGCPSLEELARWSERGWDLPPDSGGELGAIARLRAALDGNLIGPIAVAIGLGSGRVAACAHEPERRAYLGKNEPRRYAPLGDRERAAFDVLAQAGWVRWRGTYAGLTDLGAYALRRAPAFGVPVSYLPLFERLDELLFGDAERFWRRAPGEPEAHVDRAMNVRASGASHQRYFAAADAIIGRAFDLPFEAQPIGVCDMGCGDGAWLEHVWHLIMQRTERGRLLRAYPHDPRYRPLLVGADYNDAARSASRQRLTQAGIPHFVTFGDINDPQSLKLELARRGIDSTRLLHTNSFLVHNRPYAGVKDMRAAAARRSDPGAVFASRGRALSGGELGQNLAEFFAAWRLVIGEHGMVVIELHDPERVRVGRTLTNYMLTHGLSDQYTVSLGAYLDAAREAGLEVDWDSLRLFPESPEAAAISVSHLRNMP